MSLVGVLESYWEPRVPALVTRPDGGDVPGEGSEPDDDDDAPWLSDVCDGVCVDPGAEAAEPDPVAEPPEEPDDEPPLDGCAATTPCPVATAALKPSATASPLTRTAALLTIHMAAFSGLRMVPGSPAAAYICSADGFGKSALIRLTNFQSSPMRRRGGLAVTQPLWRLKPSPNAVSLAYRRRYVGQVSAQRAKRAGALEYRRTESARARGCPVLLGVCRPGHCCTRSPVGSAPTARSRSSCLPHQHEERHV